jgi:hypothetical protein
MAHFLGTRFSQKRCMIFNGQELTIHSGTFAWVIMGLLKSGGAFLYCFWETIKMWYNIAQVVSAAGY